MSEEMKNEKVQETMEDFAAELEASYKEYDEKRSQAYVADETPDAEKWQEVKQLQASCGCERKDQRDREGRGSGLFR